MPKLVAPTRREVRLDPIRSNAGVEAKYRKQLQAQIDAMHKSVRYWIVAAWRKDAPRLAQDRRPNPRRTPLLNLRKVMERLGLHWQNRFDKIADDLAVVFADGATKHTDQAMMAALKKAGFTVKFSMSAKAKEGYSAVLQENIALIKSIPAEYLHDVATDVWRTVTTGDDLHALTKKLQSRYEVTHKRAAFIARDQSNKARAVTENVRRQELGITQAVWLHSGAGKEPRPSHVAANNKRFDLDKGMLLDGEWLLPGQAINCRCTSISIIPGLDD